MANYEAVLRSVRLLNHEQGVNLGARRITISTCGLAPQIRSWLKRISRSTWRFPSML